jgi:hypothetical protein
MIKKTSKKLRVEFELDAATVAEMIKTAGTPEGKRLSKTDLEKLSETGALRASELLTQPALTAYGSVIRKALSKAVSKAGDKLSTANVQHVLVAEATDKLISTVSSPTIKGKTSGRKA